VQSVLDLVDVAGQMDPSTVAIAGGDRFEDLSLVESARDHGIIERIILVGNKSLIEQAVEQVGIEILRDDIIAADGYEAVADAILDVIRSGRADIVLKGNMSTPILNRRMLTLAARDTVSLVTLFDSAPVSGGKIMLLTDAGVTTVCNFERMIGMVDNACDVARTVLGMDEPRVAILSANEKQIPSLESTKMGLELAQRQWAGAVVCGPLSFDLATDPGSVAVKGIPDLPNAEAVAGQADILVCPGLDSANILYKSLAALNKYGLASLAGITVGFPVPYIIISRSDTMEIRLASIALCSIYARKTHADKA
jgi:phosphotransacetylase